MEIDITKIKSYYISIESPPESAEINAVLGELGFESVHPVAGITSSTSKLQNIARSNYQILKHHMSQPEFEPFIIFEEDARPLRDIEPINIPDDADALYLGFLSGLKLVDPDLFSVPDFNDIYTASSLLGAHAILFMSKEYASKCLKMAKKLSNEDHDNPNSPDVLRALSDDVEFYPALDVRYNTLFSNSKVFLTTPIFCQDNENNPGLSALSRIIGVRRGEDGLMLVR